MKKVMIAVLAVVAVLMVSAAQAACTFTTVGVVTIANCQREGEDTLVPPVEISLPRVSQPSLNEGCDVLTPGVNDPITGQPLRQGMPSCNKTCPNGQVVNLTTTCQAVVVCVPGEVRVSPDNHGILQQCMASPQGETWALLAYCPAGYTGNSIAIGEFTYRGVNGTSVSCTRISIPW